MRSTAVPMVIGSKGTPRMAIGNTGAASTDEPERNAGTESCICICVSDHEREAKVVGFNPDGVDLRTAVDNQSPFLLLVAMPAKKKPGAPLVGPALLKEACRRLRVARSLWDAHN